MRIFQWTTSVYYYYYYYYHCPLSVVWCQQTVR